jgi:hypothetical protein
MCLENMNMLNFYCSNRLVSLAAQVKHQVLTGRSLKQDQRVVIRQHAPHSVAFASLGRGKLAVNDQVLPALQR